MITKPFTNFVHILRNKKIKNFLSREDEVINFFTFENTLYGKNVLWLEQKIESCNFVNELCFAK